jgi:O-antigen ligase
MERIAFYFAFGAAASILFSIAVANICLALSMACLLFSGLKLRIPPIHWPLAVFMLGTIISLALSDDPWAGRPQIRKFYVFLILVVMSSTFRELKQVKWLTMAIGGLATISSLRALSQFATQLRNCGDSYGCLVGERITGFMSHWMTFGGQMMIALMLLTALFFWGQAMERRKSLLVLMALIIAAAIFAGGTRSIWLATAIAGSYLLFRWKRITVLIAPAIVIVALLLAPGFLRQRFESAWKPHGEMDSNDHRKVSWLTGLRMIKAHPFFGVGPQHVNLQFKQYVPPDVTKLPEGWYGHLHNIYLQFAAERGIPVLLAVLWMLGKMLTDFWKTLRKIPPGPSDARFILEAAIAVIIAIMVGGIFEHNLGDSEVLTMFLATMSCGYVAVEATRDARA